MLSCFRFALPVFTVLFAVTLPSSVSADVRDRAVVSLTFDDLPESGAASTADTGKAGKAADTISLTQTPSRIPSAFVTGSTGYSLILDPSRQQQIVIPNSDDTSRPESVTISGLFASLLPPNDATFRNCAATRDGDQCAICQRQRI